MNKPTQKSVRLALVLMCFLFLLVGTLASFNDVLKPFLQRLFKLSYGASAWIHFAFYFAYIFMAIPASIFSIRLGYRKTILLGLSIMFVGGGIGLLAGMEAIYLIYVIAVLSIAMGVAVIVVMVNPYVSRIGSEVNSAARLNLVNSFYSTGGILGPLLGASLLYRSGSENLQASQSHWVYLGLLAVLSLGLLAFLLIKIPELPIAHSPISIKSFKELTSRHRNLRFGMIAMFMYVGIEVGTGSLIAKYLVMERIWGISEEAAGKWVSVYWGSFMVGRLIAARLGNRFSAAQMLQANVLASMVLIVGVIFGQGRGAGVALLALGLSHSVMFSSIFAMGVVGLGERVQEASSFIFMLVFGGAIITFIQNNLADVPQIGIQGSFCLTFLCYLYILWYSFDGYKQGFSDKKTTTNTT